MNGSQEHISLMSNVVTAPPHLFVCRGLPITAMIKGFIPLKNCRNWT